MKPCGLCGNELSGPMTNGMAHCTSCGAWNVIEHTNALPLPDDRELARELAAELEEDGARMRDFQAAEGYGIDRSYGG